jgi:hypothetical protein
MSKRADPTPEEIAAEAAKIRAEWPEHRWAKELPEEPPVEASWSSWTNGGMGC